MPTQHIPAEHGIVARIPGDPLGYFGWPTVAALDDGRLVVASSGLRSEHICPFGKTVINFSDDEGQTWSDPRVINDCPLDDRDAGIVNLGDGKLLVSWFVTDNRYQLNEPYALENYSKQELDRWRDTLDKIDDEIAAQHVGSYVMLSADGGDTWSDRIRVPASTPHGPIQLQNGKLLYFGKRTVDGPDELHHGTIVAAHSADGGRTWTERGAVPLQPRTVGSNYHEPHVVELPSGKLIGTIRIENAEGHSLDDSGLTHFNIVQTESDDGGHTWSTPKPLNFHGSPPHLLRHSSGALVLTYGYRLEPYGERVAISHDDGVTWTHDLILRDDGPDVDLGYPSTVELPDGRLFTLYYQKHADDQKCSLLYSKWSLPEV
ncbi:MAG: hypothetical protein CMJ49_02375 [Planctomycetaceae bacterium]|nr:hypothetical protein [Planctomycetaceae bacterium]